VESAAGDRSADAADIAVVVEQMYRNVEQTRLDVDSYLRD
jgi:hypothetical protein